MAEASTTLTGIPVPTDHLDRLRRCGQSTFGNPPENFLRRQNGVRCDRLLKNGQEFSLQRTVMALGSRLQALEDFVRHILDRKMGRHHYFSVTNPFWSNTRDRRFFQNMICSSCLTCKKSVERRLPMAPVPDLRPCRHPSPFTSPPSEGSGGAEILRPLRGEDRQGSRGDRREYCGHDAP